MGEFFIKQVFATAGHYCYHFYEQLDFTANPYILLQIRQKLLERKQNMENSEKAKKQRQFKKLGKTTFQLKNNYRKPGAKNSIANNLYWINSIFEWRNEWITLFHVDKKIHTGSQAHIAKYIFLIGTFVIGLVMTWCFTYQSWTKSDLFIDSLT